MARLAGPGLGAGARRRPAAARIPRSLAAAAGGGSPAGPRLFAAGRARHGRAGERLARVLELGGPVAIKLGQFLATRGDIFGADFAEDLGRLKDRLPPFPHAAARAEVESALDAPLEAHLRRVRRGGRGRLPGPGSPRHPEGRPRGRREGAAAGDRGAGGGGRRGPDLGGHRAARTLGDGPPAGAGRLRRDRAALPAPGTRSALRGRRGGRDAGDHGRRRLHARPESRLGRRRPAGS